MSFRSTIRDMLGDAPDEARRAQQQRDAEQAAEEPAEPAAASATTTGGTTEDPTVRDETAQETYSPDAQAGTGGRDETASSGLSTADVARAGAGQPPAPQPVPTESQPAADVAQASATSTASDAGRRAADATAAGDGDASTASTAATAARAPEPAAAGDDTRSPNAPLFPSDQAEGYRGRWQDVQTGFVDEPRTAVQQADALVADVIQRLAATFAEERAGLERQWDSGEDVSTEDLRQAMRRYRSFFDRLLSL